MLQLLLQSGVRPLSGRDLLLDLLIIGDFVLMKLFFLFDLHLLVSCVVPQLTHLLHSHVTF